MMKSDSGTTAASAISDSSGSDTTARGAYKWYVLAILILINAMGAVDRSVVSVIAEPLKREFILDDKQIGMLGGFAFSLTYALAVLPMGWLIDRVDRRALLSLTVTIWSIFTAAGGLSSNFMMLVVARLGVGAAEAPSQIGSLSLVADTFPLKQRNTAVSAYIGGGALGAILAFIIGGSLLMHFTWRAVFFVASGPGLLLAALLYFTTREPERGAFDAGQGPGKEAADAGRPGLKQIIRGMLGNAALRFAIPAITIGTGVTYSLTLWTTSFLVRVHGMSVGHGAIWSGVGMGMGMAVGSLLVGPLADRISKGDQRKLALIPTVAMGIAVVACAVMTLTDTLPVALAGLSVMALMTGFFIAPGYSIIISLTPPNERGTTLATTKLVSMLIGSGVIPMLTGVISDAIGGPDSIRPALLFTTALLLPATLCYVMIHRILGRQEKLA
jgi:MFS family permease